MSKIFRLLFLFISTLFITNLATAQNLELARELIEQLKSNAPTDHGITINNYVIRDINNDGIFEVIEQVNKFENQVPGNLNVEISPAFDLHNIYSFENGEFVENYQKFRHYLTVRIYHYRLWQKLIDNPSTLTSDSKGLIEVNKDKYQVELARLIKLTEERLN